MTGSPRRRRGGQPGNQNAFLHGYYSVSAQLAPPPEDQSDRDEILNNEIEFLRESMRRIIELAAATPDADNYAILHTLTLASMAINRLVRTQNILKASKKPHKELRDALRTVILELQKNRYSSGSSSGGV